MRRSISGWFGWTPRLTVGYREFDLAQFDARVLTSSRFDCAGYPLDKPLGTLWGATGNVTQVEGRFCCMMWTPIEDRADHQSSIATTSRSSPSLWAFTLAGRVP